MNLEQTNIRVLKNNELNNIRHEHYNAFLIVLNCIIAITPELNSYFPRIIWFVIIGLWYLDAFVFFRRKEPFKYKTIFIVFVISIMYELLFKILGISSAQIGNYFVPLAFYDLIIRALFIKQYYSKSTKDALFFLIQIIVLINVIQNIVIGYIHPNAHELNYTNPENYIGMNIATTDFYNMLSYFIGMNVFVLVDSKGFFKKMLCIISIALSLFFMLTFTPRSTALFIAMIFSLLILCFHTKNGTISFLRVLIFILLLSIIIAFFSGSLIEIFPERIRIRIEAILGANEETKYLSRFELIGNSLNTFVASLKNFLFGVGMHIGPEYYYLVGQHSLITNYMAQYGCIGLTYIVIFFCLIYKMFTKDEKNIINKKLFISLLIPFFIASIMSNSFKAQNAVTAFLLYTLVINNEGEKTE